MKSVTTAERLVRVVVFAAAYEAEFPDLVKATVAGNRTKPFYVSDPRLSNQRLFCQALEQWAKSQPAASRCWTPDPMVGV